MTQRPSIEKDRQIGTAGERASERLIRRKGDQRLSLKSRTIPGREYLRKRKRVVGATRSNSGLGKKKVCWPTRTR